MALDLANPEAQATFEQDDADRQRDGGGENLAEESVRVDEPEAGPDREADGNQEEYRRHMQTAGQPGDADGDNHEQCDLN